MSKKFVKIFCEQQDCYLEKAINDYAEAENLDILQISFCYETNTYFQSHAMVLFSKEA